MNTDKSPESSAYVKTLETERLRLELESRMRPRTRLTEEQIVYRKAAAGRPSYTDFWEVHE